LIVTVTAVDNGEEKVDFLTVSIVTSGFPYFVTYPTPPVMRNFYEYEFYLPKIVNPSGVDFDIKLYLEAQYFTYDEKKRLFVFNYDQTDAQGIYSIKLNYNAQELNYAGSFLPIQPPDVNLFNQFIEIKTYVYSAPEGLTLDVQSVSETWETLLQFNKKAKRTNPEDDSALFSNCFKFEGKKGTPEFTVGSFSETELRLLPVEGSIKSNESKITVTVKDCYDLMSVDAAYRLESMELELENGYVEPEEEDLQE